MELKYKRILLKVSGEALAGDKKTGIDFEVASHIADVIKKCVEAGCQVVLVIGGGNYWRGRDCGIAMDETRADHIGMVATVINCLTMSEILEQKGIVTRVQTAITMMEVAEPYIRNRAIRHLEKGRVVICGCGTGNPFFSTDSGSALRATELKADIMLKATMVDGVYDKDPKKYPDAVKYDTLTYDEVLSKGLKVMDSTAAALMKDHNKPMLVFDLSRPENIYDIIMGAKIGTMVTA